MHVSTEIVHHDRSPSAAQLWRGARSGIRKHLNGLLRAPLVSLTCTPRSIDDYLELFDAAWSVREVRARIVRIDEEAGGAISVWLSPNENWRSFRPGQYVRLGVHIRGVRHARCFSLSSAPRDRSLRLTMKMLPDGRVCAWAARQAEVGDVVELSQALGDFVLPDPLPQKLLFISGGSGITPIMSMLQHLFDSGYAGEVTCLHYARHEIIFGAELAELARLHERFRYVPHLTQLANGAGTATAEHFSRAQLEAHVPSWADCETYVCGPASLEAAVSELYRARGFAERLHVERFVAARPQPISTGEPLSCRLVFEKSGRVAAGHGGASLLEQAERAGLRPNHGCRMGICHTCKCRKVSGVVRNELTGALSSEPDEEIQLCVSTPRSDVTLDL